MAKAGDRLFVSVYHNCVVCGGTRGYGGGFPTASHGKRHVRAGDAIEGHGYYAEERYTLTEQGAQKAVEAKRCDDDRTARVRAAVDGPTLAIRRAGDPE